MHGHFKMPVSGGLVYAIHLLLAKYLLLLLAKENIMPGIIFKVNDPRITQMSLGFQTGTPTERLRFVESDNK